MENETALIYCPIITGLSGRTAGNEGGREGRDGRDWEEGRGAKQRAREERGINQQGIRKSKATGKTLRGGSQNCALILMFILSEAAGVPCPPPRAASLARPRWLCGSPRDKTVIKPDGE